MQNKCSFSNRWQHNVCVGQMVEFTENSGRLFIKGQRGIISDIDVNKGMIYIGNNIVISINDDRYCFIENTPGSFNKLTKTIPNENY